MWKTYTGDENTLPEVGRELIIRYIDNGNQYIPSDAFYHRYSNAFYIKCCMIDKSRICLNRFSKREFLLTPGAQYMNWTTYKVFVPVYNMILRLKTFFKNIFQNHENLC